MTFTRPIVPAETTTRPPTWAQQIEAALKALLKCPVCPANGQYAGEDWFACRCGKRWRLVREEST